MASPVIPLESTEPSSTTDTARTHPVATDLVHLSQWIGEATLVGLGEGSHGTHTLHRLTHRIFEHLVEEEGFEVFALEIDQAHAATLNAFVQGERDDLDALMQQGWWAQKIFYDEALADLLRWMRRTNASTERRLHFVGYDAKQPRLAAEQLASAIHRLDPAAHGVLEARLEEALALGGFGVYPNVWGFSSTIAFTMPARTELSANPLTVAVKVGGDGVDYGSVGFSARFAEGGWSRVRLVPIDCLHPAGATYSVEVEGPGDPSSASNVLELSVFHRGNGTVWFERPVVQVGEQQLETSDGFETSGEPATIEPSPLRMPAVQHMDYQAKVQLEEGGPPTLRITADPRLDQSLEATRSVERQVEGLLRRHGTGRVPEAEASWLRQLARLVTQAVEWRTLAETNRDVFLAKNLLWVHRTALPGRRTLVLAHTSHTERIPRRMGDFVARALGEDHVTVSMVAGSGVTSNFGDVSAIDLDTSLQRFDIDPARLSPLAKAAEALDPGNFLVQVPKESDAVQTLDRALCEPSCPEVLIFVRGVEPLRGVN